jgi:hypothetical protein
MYLTARVKIQLTKEQKAVLWSISDHVDISIISLSLIEKIHEKIKKV